MAKGEPRADKCLGGGQMTLLVTVSVVTCRESKTIIARWFTRQRKRALVAAL